MKTLYYTLAYPHLSYGIILWGSTYAKYTNKLVVMQKKLVRAIMDVAYNEHTNVHFMKLGLLRFNDIHTLEVAKFMHKYVHKDLPEPLSNIFIYTHSIHSHHTRQSRSMRPLACRLSSSRNSVLFKGPTVWNSLPSELQNKSSLFTFNKHLKDSMIRKYRYTTSHTTLH